MSCEFVRNRALAARIYDALCEINTGAVDIEKYRQQRDLLADIMSDVDLDIVMDVVARNRMRDVLELRNVSKFAELFATDPVARGRAVYRETHRAFEYRYYQDTMMAELFFPTNTTAQNVYAEVEWGVDVTVVPGDVLVMRRRHGVPRKNLSGYWYVVVMIGDTIVFERNVDQDDKGDYVHVVQINTYASGKPKWRLELRKYITAFAMVEGLYSLMIL